MTGQRPVRHSVRKSSAVASNRRKPEPLDAATTARLSAVRSSNTGAEQTVRKYLTKSGIRYRLHNKDLPGSPDIANRAGRWAVFVHGCFWHAHAGCERAGVPKHNRQYWVQKFAQNVQRDARAVASLRRAGYRVIVAWECETRSSAALRRKLRPICLQCGARASRDRFGK